MIHIKAYIPSQILVVLYLYTFEVQYLVSVFKILFGYVSVSYLRYVGKVSYTALQIQLQV